MTKPALAVLAAMAACAAIAPGMAAAQSPSATATAVTFSDLDLQREDQVAELDRRLELAVSAVCGERAAPEFQAFHDWNRCRNEARNTAAEGRALALGQAGERNRRVNIEQRSR